MKLTEGAQEALYSIAYTCFKQGQYTEAVALFRTMSTVNPRIRKYWLGLGACYQAMQEYNQALKSYEMAAMLDPGDPHVHLYAATCFFSQRQAKEGLKALDCAEAVLKRFPLEKRRNWKAHISLLRQAWKKEAA